MPGVSPAAGNKVSPVDQGDGSSGPAPTPENPGGMHPEGSSQGQAPRHFQPPVDPSKQNIDSSSRVRVPDGVEAQGSSVPQPPTNDAAQAFENPMAMREPVGKLLDGIEAMLQAIGTEMQASNSGSNQHHLITKLESWKKEAQTWSGDRSSKLYLPIPVKRQCEISDRSADQIGCSSYPATAGSVVRGKRFKRMNPGRFAVMRWPGGEK
ncbi:uncharacterized protein L969DRAFT_97301 [Mixia osmundae IAM 14324]|uniref:Uncharacterized protein n=1 Tax=Mixia osmundae (strain CBS 9802 / IAM 14324 / JCM 22182 / KY 12970) TaxID=764103 RepID=G7EB54_MIXOS|nr:uncharacterized protein L969DRAFT_97301 [Mixia osmundae IAM 14324]KEI36568.1 hypothetical protein L969DRAFT_97301 [Mixia osmundae IAM 14324]GAB00065.1 hypothetical protein E5Q_06767 [Mixia osmundae IAM 14324]